MALRLALEPYFWAAVKFSMIGDNDTSLEITFKGKFRRLEQEAYEALMKRVNATRMKALTTAAAMAETEPDDAPKPITDREIVDMALMDWQDVLGEDDQPLPFTKDNLNRVLKTLGCRSAIVMTYIELHQKELEKNFDRPSGTSTED
jgi:hypothetical protein